MEIYLDSADLGEVREAVRLFPISGVTTNPTILARSGADNPLKRLIEIKDEIGDRLLFAQLTDTTPEGGLAEALLLREKLGNNICIKIPVTKDTLGLMKAVREQGIKVCATACYSVPQAILAQEAGVDYVAPYVSHIDNLPEDGPARAIAMQQALNEKYLPAFRTEGVSVLGASFRTQAQIQRLMEGGVKAVTVTFAMLESLASHAGSDREVSAFTSNWTGAYGPRHFIDFI